MISQDVTYLQLKMSILSLSYARVPSTQQLRAALKFLPRKHMAQEDFRRATDCLLPTVDYSDQISFESAMKVLGILITILVCDFIEATVNWATLSRYNHFSKRNNPSTQLYTGGRIQEREIEYLYTAGYKSIISISNFTTNDTNYKNIDGSWPSSDYEKSISNLLGLSMEYFESDFTIDSLNYLSDLIEKIQKPVYIHCHVGYSATLFTQLYLYKTGIIGSDSFIASSLALGYDYQSDSNAVAFINEITGLNLTLQNEIIESNLIGGESGYRNYYWLHRIGNDIWYNSGQILDTHVNSIASIGIKTVISFRAANESTTRLPSDPTSGKINNHEFEDDYGNYDPNYEIQLLNANGIDFLNLPVSGTDAYTSAQFFSYLDSLKNAKAPILTHCAAEYRSAAYVVAYLAYESKLCSDWALKESAKIGYSYDINESDQTVVAFFQEVLKC